MYDQFLKSISATQWKRVGLKRRAGVCTPLFSIYSKKSVGIGEIPDLKLLIDWCQTTGMSLIQLLPLNDTGFGSCPYDAQSGFALDPMYVSFRRLSGVNLRLCQSEIDSLQVTFQMGSRVNYKIKSAKLKLLWKVFKEKPVGNDSAFRRFVRRNQFWIHDYALFKVIKEQMNQRTWEEWPRELRDREAETLKRFGQDHSERTLFFKWLQWQLYQEFREVREYTMKKKVFFVGDLPFLASRDSADVWSHPEYFKLNLSSGAPPDAYFFKGQRWGMPPCDWEYMAEHGYDYLMERLKCAEQFYDCLRLDHVVGFYRLWTIPISEPLENAGMNGRFDPADENVWEEHGRKLLSLMIQNTKMLICGEDLGTVPECSYRVLDEFGIPGTDVQRWVRDPSKEFAFRAPEEYRKNSIATFSTHDMASFKAWWEYEAGTVYGPLFERRCAAKGIPFNEVRSALFDPGKSFHDRLRWREEIRDVKILVQILNRREEEIGDVIDLYRFSYNEKQKFWNYLGFEGTFEEKSSPRLAKAASEKISATASIFSIQLLQDWLAIGNLFKGDSWDVRINFPGTIGQLNWTLRMPISLEELKNLSLNKTILAINLKAQRI